MKVAPVSADLLIKIGLGVLVLGAGYLAFKRLSGAVNGSVLQPLENLANSVKSGFQAVVDAPGHVADWALTETETRGAAIQAANAPQSQEMQDLTGRKYSNPLMNNDGMDFGLLSG